MFKQKGKKPLKSPGVPKRHKKGKIPQWVKNAIFFIFLFALALTGVIFLISQLNDICGRQYVLQKEKIDEVDKDDIIRYGEGCVVIKTGRTQLEGTIRHFFGIKQGADIDKIDFNNLRKLYMKKFPVVKTLKIVRKLPLDIEIELIEREPIAKLMSDRSFVADDEGVVFPYPPRFTTRLPEITNRSSQSRPQPGMRLTDHAFSALRVIKELRTGTYSQLNVVQVEIGNPDYLYLTFSDYMTRAKFAWENMGVVNDESDLAMRQQLRCLNDAMMSGPGFRMWNAIVPGRITGN